MSRSPEEWARLLASALSKISGADGGRPLSARCEAMIAETFAVILQQEKARLAREGGSARLPAASSRTELASKSPSREQHCRISLDTARVKRRESDPAPG